MNNNQHNHHEHGGPHANLPHDQKPYWKRAHHDWRFWVAAILIFTAMIIYVMTDNLAWRPRSQTPTLVVGPAAK